MCGIAGVFSKSLSDIDQNASHVFLDLLKHRGPDGHGQYRDDSISLAHTRLSIIDLSAQANQPLFNEDKTIVLVCNGEIYNYLELRRELISKNHHFVSNSDSEVILHLYEEYQDKLEELLARLTGMFAFALWDSRRKRLLIARDRLGIKPLYYYRQNNKLIFSSEVKPIALSGIANFTLDHTSLYEYFLVGSIPGPNTMYNEIKALDPGHYIVAEDAKFSIHSYWDVSPKLGKWKKEDDVVAEVEYLLSEIIKEHLVADVPIGTFLSAGVDSSLITAIAAEYHPAIHTFTTSFPGEPEDEGQVAEHTARLLKTTHKSYKLEGNFFHDFDKQFSDLDQPFANISALSLGRISELASKEIKVVLSGDGGDELFGGYSRHKPQLYPPFMSFIPGGMQNTALRIGAIVTRKQSLEKLRQHINKPETEKYLSKYTVLNPEFILSLFSDNIKNKIDEERYITRLKNMYNKFEQNDPLNKLLYVDIKTTLVDEMLTKCDRMTMINRIEGRVPFLDHRLVELAFSIPASFKRNNQHGKLPLRKILAKKLGNELAFREKTGYNSPIKKWLAQNNETANFAYEQIKSSGKLEFFNKHSIEKCLSEFNNLDVNAVFSLICLNKYFNK